MRVIVLESKGESLLQVIMNQPFSTLDFNLLLVTLRGARYDVSHVRIPDCAARYQLQFPPYGHATRQGVIDQDW